MKRKLWILTVFFIALLGTTIIASALTVFFEDFDGNTTLDGWGKHRQGGDILEVASNWAYQSTYSMHVLLDGYSPEQVTYSMGVDTTEIATISMPCNSHEVYVKAKVYVTQGINNLAGDRDNLMFIYFWGTQIQPTGPVTVSVCSVGIVRYGRDYFNLNTGNGGFCTNLAVGSMGKNAWYTVELGFLRGSNRYGKIGGNTIYRDTAPAVNVTKIEVGLMATKQTWSGNLIEAYVDDVEVRANGISPSSPTPPNGNGNGDGNGNGQEGSLPDWLQGILEFLGVDLMTFLLIAVLVIVVIILLSKH